MQKFNARTVLILTFLNFAQNDVQDGEKSSGSRRENDFRKLDEMLKAMQMKNTQFIKREVIIDDEKHVTIDNLYEGLDTDRRHTYSLFHILNIVLSCEYSAIIYDYIALSDNNLKTCVNKIPKDKSMKIPPDSTILDSCLTTYHLEHLNVFLAHAKKMTLSLAGLVYFTRNVVYKYHDVLKILLSFYVYMHQMAKYMEENILELSSYKLKNEYLQSISITNVQEKVV